MRASDPPYVIRTERLTVRCWEPGDAPRVKQAVDESLAELRPWMPWAHDDPQPVEQKVALLRRFRGQFDLGEDFVYGLLTRDGSEVVGGAGLHTRVGGGGLEIGYWIRSDRTGRGLATEAAGALTRVAFEVCRVDRVEIRVDPANTRSAAIPLRLGFGEEATLRRRLPVADPADPRRDVTVFSLFREDFPATPSAAVELEAYDAAGVRVL